MSATTDPPPQAINSAGPQIHVRQILCEIFLPHQVEQKTLILYVTRERGYFSYTLLL